MIFLCKRLVNKHKRALCFALDSDMKLTLGTVNWLYYDCEKCAVPSEVLATLFVKTLRIDYCYYGYFSEYIIKFATVQINNKNLIKTPHLHSFLWNKNRNIWKIRCMHPISSKLSTNISPHKYRCINYYYAIFLLAFHTICKVFLKIYFSHNGEYNSRMVFDAVFVRRVLKLLQPFFVCA